MNPGPTISDTIDAFRTSNRDKSSKFSGLPSTNRDFHGRTSIQMGSMNIFGGINLANNHPENNALQENLNVDLMSLEPITLPPVHIKKINRNKNLHQSIDVPRGESLASAKRQFDSKEHQRAYGSLRDSALVNKLRESNKKNGLEMDTIEELNVAARLRKMTWKNRMDDQVNKYKAQRFIIKWVIIWIVDIKNVMILLKMKLIKIDK